MRPSGHAEKKSAKVEDSFFAEVYALVKQIPSGKVASYGQIAWMLGRPRSAREVGRAMRFCPSGAPWHRVVLADGTLASGVDEPMAKTLLESEGVIFISARRVDMKACRW